MGLRWCFDNRATTLIVYQLATAPHGWNFQVYDKDLGAGEAEKEIVNRQSFIKRINIPRGDNIVHELHDNGGSL